jgi:hypothetical protein
VYSLAGEADVDLLWITRTLFVAPRTGSEVPGSLPDPGNWQGGAEEGAYGAELEGYLSLDDSDEEEAEQPKAPAPAETYVSFVGSVMHGCLLLSLIAC